jgi:cell division GTPase FtsZ
MKSFSISVIGLGQGGCRLAKSFFDGGHEDCAFINTARVDLGGLNVPEEKKLLIGDGDGAGKDMQKSLDALIERKDEIKEIIRGMVSSDKILVCASSGGGTGSGTVSEVVSWCNHIVEEAGTKCSVGALVSMPGKSELVSDKIKSNALKCLENLSEMVELEMLRPLMVVSNDDVRIHAKIKSLRTFFDDSNKYIYGMINEFNTRSAEPTMLISLDKNDLATVFNCPGTVFISKGEIKNPNDPILIKRVVDAAFKKGGLIHGDGKIPGKDCAMILKLPSSFLDGDPGFFERFSGLINDYLKDITDGMVHRGYYEDERIKTPVIYTMSVSSRPPIERVRFKLSK